MMKRKINGMIGILIGVVLLSGCGTKFPELSEEQNQQVAEYAVGLLMKYDEKHESRLLNEVQLEKELSRLKTLAERKAQLAEADQARKQAKEEEQRQKEEALENTPVANASETAGGSQPAAMYMEDFFGLEGIQIRYAGYSVEETYPSSGDGLYFMVQANSGQKLLVLSFAVSNVMETEQQLDMISLKPQFKVAVNQDNAQYALSTLLADDLANYRGAIQPGETITLVMIAQIPAEMSEQISNIEVVMKNDTNSATTLLN